MARLLLMAILFQVVLVFGTSCPTPGSIDLNPCFCEERKEGAFIICTNVVSPDTLDDVFLKLTDWPVAGLFVLNSTLPFIPTSDIVRKRIQFIKVMNSTLDRLFDQMPSDANDVKTVFLDNVTLSSGVQWELFKTLLNLQDLILDRVEVPELGESFVDNIPSGLNYLDLEYTNLTEMADNVFANLNAMEYLRIANNHISTLNSSMFPYPSRMKMLGFEHNHIQRIPSSLFRQMPELRDVYFQGNRIKMFSQSVFESLLKNGNVTTLNLSDNPIACDCSLEWYVNNFEDVPVYGTCGSPPNLQERSIQGLEIHEPEGCPYAYYD